MKEKSSTKQNQKCPTCHKPTVHAHRPFCSRRCADIDLGMWLSGSFVIPGSEQENMSENSSEKISLLQSDETHSEE